MLKWKNALRGACIVAVAVVGVGAHAGDGERAISLPSETPETFTPRTEAFDYDKREVMIAMRDGVKLKTLILVPKGAANAPDAADAHAVQRGGARLSLQQPAPGSGRAAHERHLGRRPATSSCTRTCAESTGPKATTC